MPSNLATQWRAEIKKHTKDLKVLVMVSMESRLPVAEELKNYDLVLFSKPRFEKEAKENVDIRGREIPDRNNRRLNGHEPECLVVTSHTGYFSGELHLQDYIIVYHSPLKQIHFKRLIVDEGHTFGNSSNNSKTEAVTVVDFLQVSSRWIVSGTPTQGLYGTEVAIGQEESLESLDRRRDSREYSRDLIESFQWSSIRKGSDDEMMTKRNCFIDRSAGTSRNLETLQLYS